MISVYFKIWLGSALNFVLESSIIIDYTIGHDMAKFGENHTISNKGVIGTKLKWMVWKTKCINITSCIKMGQIPIQIFLYKKQ